jgi:DNA-binding transcriptional LysR family regulator
LGKLSALKAFVQVIELHGFAAASRKLGQSPSVTTRQVARLEEELGVRLLNRSTRSVSLTDAGAHYLERVRPIVAQLEEADRLAGDEQAEPTGRLSITAPLIFGRMHVAPLLCHFMDMHPGVTGDLRLTDSQINLVEEGLDLALRIGKLQDSADIARKVGKVRRVLVASPAYLEKAGHPQCPDDLSQHRTIALTAVGDPHVWRFGTDGNTQRVAINPAYVTNSADAAIWHACNHGGLTLALSYQIVDFVRGGALQPVMVAQEPEPLPISFVYPSSRLLTRRVRAFIELSSAKTNWDFTQL